MSSSHEKTAQVETMPRSNGPVARLNKNSVGTGDWDKLVAAVSDSFLLGDMGKAKNSKVNLIESQSASANTAN